MLTTSIEDVIMLNEHLKKAKDILSDKFFCVFKEKTILEVSIDKEDLPFLYLILEDNDLILMSFSVEFNNASMAAQLALMLYDITDVGVAENFYLSKEGELFWDDAALLKMAEEDQINSRHPLLDMKPISSSKH